MKQFKWSKPPADSQLCMECRSLTHLEKSMQACVITVSSLVSSHAFLVPLTKLSLHLTNTFVITIL